MNKSASDTIVAIGTKPGEAAIGIIRLSGNKSIKLAEKKKKKKNRKKSWKRKMYRRDLTYVKRTKTVNKAY